MPEADGGTQHSVRRWWEIPSGRRSQEGRNSELLTGGRARVRPERSLTVGVDLAEEATRRWRAYLWPILAAVVAVALFVLLIVLALVL